MFINSHKNFILAGYNRLVDNRSLEAKLCAFELDLKVAQERRLAINMAYTGNINLQLMA